MSTWYMTRWHDSYDQQWSGPKLEEVEILKSTSSSVWVGERRKAKRSEYENYFETRQEAVDFIRIAQSSKIAQYKDLIAKHQATLKRFDAAGESNDPR